MAILNYNVQVDMSTPQFWYGDVYLANATNIIIDAGSYRGIYSGSFKYSKTGAVSGKLNSYEQFDNGVLQGTGQNLNFNAATAYNYIQILGDAQAFTELLLKGNDTVYGSGYSDTLLGYKGKDTLYGYNGNDLINGGVGDDKIYGGDDNDYLLGEAGNDLIYAGSGVNLILGGDGNDKIYGEDGENWLGGGNGNDTIIGGSLGNYLVGGLGNDTITGGSNPDLFVFSDAASSSNKDTIKSFQDGSDVIFLDPFIFTNLASIAEENIVNGKSALDPNDYLIFFKSTLYYDNDGSGPQKMQPIATFQGISSLHVDDITITDLAF
jgi:Ca2+-binding RTX toxin-like protein